MKNLFKGFGEWVREESPKHQREMKMAELRKKLASDEAYLRNVGAAAHGHEMDSSAVSPEDVSRAETTVGAATKRVAEMSAELKALEEEAMRDQ